MSTILKALRRLEEEQGARGEIPLREAVTASPQRSRGSFRWGLGAALTVSIAFGAGALAFWSVRDEAPNPQATAPVHPSAPAAVADASVSEPSVPARIAKVGVPAAAVPPSALVHEPGPRPVPAETAAVSELPAAAYASQVEQVDRPLAEPRIVAGAAVAPETERPIAGVEGFERIPVEELPGRHELRTPVAGIAAAAPAAAEPARNETQEPRPGAAASPEPDPWEQAATQSAPKPVPAPAAKMSAALKDPLAPAPVAKAPAPAPVAKAPAPAPVAKAPAPAPAPVAKAPAPAPVAKAPAPAPVAKAPAPAPVAKAPAPAPVAKAPAPAPVAKAPAPAPVAKAPAPAPAPVAKAPAPAPVAKAPAPAPVAKAPAPVAKAPAPAPVAKAPAPAPVAKAPAPAPKATPVAVAKATPPRPEPAAKVQLPGVQVERTTWHPSAARRTALLTLASGEEQEVHEGDAVGRLVVEKIEPSGVVFLAEGVEVRRRIGER